MAKEQKSFYRVRLALECPDKVKIIKGIKITKNWKVVQGTPDGIDRFTYVEVQPVMLCGNEYIPIEKAKEVQRSFALDTMSDNDLRDYLKDCGVEEGIFKDMSREQLIKEALGHLKA